MTPMQSAIDWLKVHFPLASGADMDSLAMLITNVQQEARLDEAQIADTRIAFEHLAVHRKRIAQLEKAGEEKR
jgi:hypothetical protein